MVTLNSVGTLYSNLFVKLICDLNARLMLNFIWVRGPLTLFTNNEYIYVSWRITYESTEYFNASYNAISRELARVSLRRMGTILIFV